MQLGLSSRRIRNCTLNNRVDRRHDFKIGGNATVAAQYVSQFLALSIKMIIASYLAAKARDNRYVCQML